MTTGELLDSKSSVTNVSALTHLQNITGGGDPIYTPIEQFSIDVSQHEMTVDIQDTGINVVAEDNGITVNGDNSGMTVDLDENDLEALNDNC